MKSPLRRLTPDQPRTARHRSPPLPEQAAAPVEALHRLDQSPGGNCPQLQGSCDMELASGGPTAVAARVPAIALAPKVFASLPTTSTRENRFCAASIHVPDSPFLRSGQPPQKLCQGDYLSTGEALIIDRLPLRVEVVVQNPFPGLWVLHHQTLAHFFLLCMWFV